MKPADINARSDEFGAILDKLPNQYRLIFLASGLAAEVMRYDSLETGRIVAQKFFDLFMKAAERYTSEAAPGTPFLEFLNTLDIGDLL